MAIPELSPWLTVVTIVKDDPEGFLRSVDSLRGQDLDGVEFVIVDGSQDRARVESQVGPAAIEHSTYIWEQPRGVYEAMNSGLRASTGDYIYFLNAGDSLTPGALRTFRTLVKESSADWAFGQVAFIDSHGSAVVPQPFIYTTEKRLFFARGRFPSHQGTLVRRELLIEHGGFDTDFRVAADYAAMLVLSRTSDPAITNEVVAEFHLGGLSSTQWRLSLREFHRARIKSLELSGLDRVREAGLTSMTFLRMLAGRTLSRVRKTP